MSINTLIELEQAAEHSKHIEIVPIRRGERGNLYKWHCKSCDEWAEAEAGIGSTEIFAVNHASAEDLGWTRSEVSA